MASADNEGNPLISAPDGAPAAAATSKPASSQKSAVPNLFTCHICGAVIKYRSNFNRHLERQHKNKTTPCRLCGKLFRDKSELRNHMQSGVHVAPKALYTCATCGGRFSSQRALLHHSHEKVSAFPCDICRRKFQTAVVRAAHRRRHFWRGLPRCRVCSATFAAEQHLSRHIRNHESETSEVVRY